jgi:hypothetical protein
VPIYEHRCEDCGRKVSLFVRRNRRGPRSVRPADRRACITTLRAPQIRNPAVEGALKGRCRFRYWMSAARMKLPTRAVRANGWWCAATRCRPSGGPASASNRSRRSRSWTGSWLPPNDSGARGRAGGGLTPGGAGAGRLESGEALFRGEHPRKFAVFRVAHTRSPRLRRLGMMRLPRTAWSGTNVAPSPLCCSLRSGGNHPGGSPCVMSDPPRAGRAGSGCPVSRIRAGGADVGEGVAG